MAGIVLSGIKKTFGDVIAVQNLDIDIANGELLALLGPSGCGKSTTLDMIAGAMQPSSGSILFDGLDVTEYSPHERNVAMVFQSALLYPHMTARQNIFMSLKRSGLPKVEIERRIKEAAAIVDTTRLLDKMPGQLSGEERQRVATAKAIVRNPACFLLDEPLGALDAALRLTLRSELVNLQKRLKTTMILVTHDQVEAMTMGDCIGAMRNGGLEQIGNPGSDIRPSRNAVRCRLRRFSPDEFPARRRRSDRRRANLRKWVQQGPADGWIRDDGAKTRRDAGSAPALFVHILGEPATGCAPLNRLRR